MRSATFKGSSKNLMVMVGPSILLHENVVGTIDHDFGNGGIGAERFEQTVAENLALHLSFEPRAW
jgi:hypothetical protein